MTQEALKLALEALEQYVEYEGETRAANEAIIAIKEALRENAMREVQRLGQEIEQEPEYAWPTVADYERDVGFQTNEAFRMAWGMARTTNKMLGHPSPPQQEPVAYWKEHAQGLQRDYDSLLADFQAQRTWVGMTDDDKKQITKEANYHWEMTAGEYAERIGQLTEAKLKEKNT